MGIKERERKKKFDRPRELPAEEKIISLCLLDPHLSFIIEFIHNVLSFFFPCFYNEITFFPETGLVFLICYQIVIHHSHVCCVHINLD